MNKKIAINYLSGNSYEVFEADKYVKRVLETCEFWFECHNWTILLRRKLDKPQKGFEYNCYVIDGNLYESLLTNPHEELIKFAPKIVQETLF